MRVPEPFEGAPGLFVVDATWGAVNPLQLIPGVVTIGELELIEQLERGRRLIDTRSEDSYRRSTIPGAINISGPELVVERIEELDRDVPSAFFCNGPQCPISPRAIRELHEAGHPPEALLYYRGGMHDWITLGFPTSRGHTPGPTRTPR